MHDATSERRPALLQERAKYINSIKHVAVATRIQLVVRGLDDLASRRKACCNATPVNRRRMRRRAS